MRSGSGLDEARRLASLRAIGLLDTDAEERFDRFTRLASALFDTPIALISLVDEHRQWFKSRVGLDLAETPRDVSFCAHAIEETSTELFVVDDAWEDERFASNPLVTGEPGIRFYAGRVLHDRDGFALGTLCVIDRQPRHLSVEQSMALDDLGALVEDVLHRRTEAQLVAHLDASERRKSLILDTLSEGVVLQAADGAIIEWNPAAERVLGLSSDELGGRMSTDTRWLATDAGGVPWPGDTHPAMEALSTARPVLGVLMGIRQPDGQERWLRVNANPVLGADGRAEHVLTAFSDVTAEVAETKAKDALERALAHSEEAARVSLDVLEQGVILADRSGRIHRVNPAAEVLLGYSASELTDLWRSGDWLSFHEDGSVLAMEDRPIHRAMTQNRPVWGEIIGWRRRDGYRLLLRLSCIPVPDDSGWLVIAFRDITADRLHRRLLDATLETAPVGLAIVDAAGIITRANPAFAEQAQRPIASLVGMTLSSLVHDDDRPVAEQAMRVAAAGRVVGDASAIEQRLVRPDGSSVWVRTQLASIPDPDRPLVIAAMFDVTEQRELVIQLRRFGHLIQHANDLVIIVDEEATVLYASPSCDRFFGPLGVPAGLGGLGTRVQSADRADLVTRLQRLAVGQSSSEPFVIRVDAAVGARDLECVAVNLLHEPAVGGIVITARDCTEREHLTRQLSHQATHDPLTGLANRHLLDERLTEALARAVRASTRIAVCCFDLDGFKQVNDTFGHSVGDELLVDVASLLRSSVRGGDTAARLGGDELVLVLDPIDDEAHARAVVERVRREIVDLGRRHAPGLSVGASVGLAINEPGDVSASLLKRADDALYDAKRGRAR